MEGAVNLEGYGAFLLKHSANSLAHVFGCQSPNSARRLKDARVPRTTTNLIFKRKNSVLEDRILI